jgi:peptidoglycan LD-endopeptidase CwlK
LILHSELTKALRYQKAAGFISDRGIEEVLRLTRNGVQPEGGIGAGTLREAMGEQESVRLDTTKSGWVTPTSGFRFGSASVKEMQGVLPQLLEVAARALNLSQQDFIFYDGARTYKEQVALKAAGRSQTLNSKHIIQSDGYGHAMDLVPYIDGGPKWDWEGCYKIACAVDQAASQLGYANNIVWGGAWDRRLSDFGGDPHLYKAEVELYKSRHPGKDFIDGPHFEWRA